MKKEFIISLGTEGGMIVTFLFVIQSNLDDTNGILLSVQPISFTTGDGSGLADYRSVTGLSTITTKDQIIGLLNFRNQIQGDNHVVIREGMQIADLNDFIDFTAIKGVDMVYIQFNIIDPDSGEPISFVVYDTMTTTTTTTAEPTTTTTTTATP